MSPFILIITFLVLVNSYDISESDRALWRRRRSLMNLDSMIKSVTSKSGVDFVGYGNYCGFGGSGYPSDPIDECCQNHDLCYDLASVSLCKDQKQSMKYKNNYQWFISDVGRITCEESKDKCLNAICICDGVLTSCLRDNMQSYNPDNIHPQTLENIASQAKLLTED